MRLPVKIRMSEARNVGSIADTAALTGRATAEAK